MTTRGYSVKQEILLRRPIDSLLDLLGNVPFLSIKQELSDVRGARYSEGAKSVDWLLALAVGGCPWNVFVETKISVPPRMMRDAVQQLQNKLWQLPVTPPSYGIVTALYISEEAGRLCTEAGLGYVDAAGNARICFGNIFILTRGAENPLRQKRELKSLFGDQAARVLRTMLQAPERPWKMVALAKTAGVSLGWLSAVRQKLLAQEWAEEQKDGLVLSRPDLLM